MANPLPNEKELYEQIKKERISINPQLWDLLYERLGDDITAINLACHYFLEEGHPIPALEAGKLLNYTHHIKDIINKVTCVSMGDFPFPEFWDDSPLHPILREMLTHYIGNDVYMINLIVKDSIDPLGDGVLAPENIKKILAHTRSIREFMNRLREATIHQERIEESIPTKEKKKLTKEEIFLKIRHLLAGEFKESKEEQIKLESHFINDLYLDSVDAILVVMILEEGFGFEIPDKDSEGILTVSQAVDYIFKRLEKTLLT